MNHWISSAYHPQTNSLDERMNQTITRAHSKYINDDQYDWDELLDPILFAVFCSTMELWVLAIHIVASVGQFFNSEESCLIQIASCAALGSQLLLLIVQHVCFLVLQLTAAPLIWKRYPDVNFYCAVCSTFVALSSRRS